MQDSRSGCIEKSSENIVLKQKGISFSALEWIAEMTALQVGGCFRNICHWDLEENLYIFVPIFQKLRLKLHLAPNQVETF